MMERIMAQSTTITHTEDIDPIRCPHCGELAYMIRRTPNAFKRDGTEVWTFQCVNGHNTSKSDRR
jgi:hypothetical protein